MVANASSLVKTNVMIRALLFCTLLSASLSLYGQNTNRGFTVGLQHSSSLQEALGGQLYRDTELFNLQAGYRWSDRWETGLNLRPFQLFDRSRQLNTDLYARYYFALPKSPRLQPYLEANGGLNTSFRRNDYNYRTVQLGLAAGVAYQLSDRFSATWDLGYNRQLRNYEFQLDTETNPTLPFYRAVDGRSSSGQLQMRLTLRYHFGKRNRNRPQ